MGKTIVIAAAALLLGILVGGIGPRRELTETKKALAEAEAKSRASGVAAALPLALGLGSLAASGREGAPPAAAPARTVPRFTPEPAPAAPEADEAARRRSPLRDGEAFAAARTAAEVRASQFKAAFVEEARLPPAAVAALDTSVQKMNEELSKAATDALAALKARRDKGEKLLPRDFADVGAQFLEIYRRNDDAWKTALDDNARAAAGRTEFDLVTQVDIGAFQQLAESFGRGELGRPGRAGDGQ